MSSGNKYHRAIRGLTPNTGVTVDVYAVLVAFDVRCPARQHAIKKLLCAGLRNKGSVMQDLTEAWDAITRAIAMEKEHALGSMMQKMCKECDGVIRYQATDDEPGVCERCLNRKQD